MKIVINREFGGFSLSRAARERYDEITRQNFADNPEFFDDDIERTDVALIQLVEEFGKAANGPHADLKIIEIPDGIEWELFDYDGVETVIERGHFWWR
jgi:hypothetical protein